MKKILKRIALGLSILVLLVLIAIGITIWVVFTPEKLTPIVRKQAANYITCQAEIGQVELTFFSTFPKFGLKVTQFALVNPMPNAQSDTLVAAQQFIGVFDVAAWWKRNELVFNEVILRNGTINAFVDSAGGANFYITATDTAAMPVDTAEVSEPFKFIDIKSVVFDNVNLSYVDQELKLEAFILNLNGSLSGFLESDVLTSKINVAKANVSVTFEGEPYLRNAMVKIDMPVEVNLNNELVKLTNATASVNSIDFALSGTVQNDSISIHTDLNYKVQPFVLADMLALVPPSFQSYLDGLVTDGLVSSSGEVKGAYNDKEMPLMNLKFDIKNGFIKYTELPFPLNDVNGNFEFYSDLSNDAISYFKINALSAKTPRSNFKTKGIVKNLFTDVLCNLTTDASLNLSEFKSFIPADLNMDVKGQAKGSVKSLFTLSQVDKMQIEKMKISGVVVLTNFDVQYDSIYLKTNQSKVTFVLPNPNKSNVNSPFLYAKINSDDIDAGMLDGTFARMRNASLFVETSNVMEAANLPNVACFFTMDTLSAGMDTISLAVREPKGSVSLLSKEGGELDNVKLNFSNEQLKALMGTSAISMSNAKLNADVTNPLAQPTMKVTYSGDNLKMNMGTDEVSIAKINMNANVENDTTQRDLFMQWLANGFMEMDQGVITTAQVPHPIEIPSIKFDFNPEVFNIKESKLKLDKSDFSLSGKLSNILSYYRGDSLLRGDFKFVSQATDLLQLMEITNGMGSPEPPKDTTYSGPYMVPKGMDLRLRANVNKATFGYDTLSNVNGEVRVKDGILVLDGLVFNTPGGNMQLTTIYQTPRRNHLYLGLDYHLLNIEIEELLDMIPELDSIMPMLRSFKGKGEFHMAVETYTDSLYNLKKSTLRGACSIKGQNLVLMDGQAFTDIAKTLRFSKKTKNMVDSLSAEFTIFKQEIDIYPFLISMDKYKAVVSGRHNMDMSFNYHISLVDSPLPIKLGVDVSGTIDNLKYRPAKCKYAQMYRPAARGEVKNKQLELRRIIREALTQKVIKE
jgi:hypothetical protein